MDSPINIYMTYLLDTPNALPIAMLNIIVFVFFYKEKKISFSTAK